jgi:glycosyltransferase 2 family protein
MRPRRSGPAGLASDATAAEQDLAAAFDRLLGWLEPLWTMCYAAASVVSAGLLLAAIAGRRTALARDITLAAAGALGTGWVVARSVDGDAPSLADMLWTSGDPSYPAVRVAIVSAAVVVAGPDLTRPARRAGAAVVGLAAMASVVLGSAYPSHVLGGLGLGFGVGAAVRLTFGSSAGFPTIDRVRSALHHLGVDAIDVRVAPRQGVGPARYIAESGQGSLAISVYGRDARDAQIVARVWRALWYRDPGPQASYTRREQVDHEALMLLLARRRADVLVADVVGVGSASTGDVVLVTLQPDAPTLADLPADELTDGLLAQVWAAAARLRGAGIGHGRLNAASILVADGEVLVTDLAAARMHAPAAVLATDLAELLVSCSLLVGEARAVASARAGVGDEALRDALPFVQHAALSPGLRDEVRARHADVDALRLSAARAAGGEAPEVAELHRIRLRDVLLMVLTLVAAYTLLGQLADVGLDTIVDELSNAELGWVLFGLVLAQLALVTDAAATIAAVGGPLPLGPTTLLQSAVKFINLSVPSVAGKLALTVRFLQRQGVATSLAVSQGAIDSLAGFVVQAVVLVVVVPIIDIDVDLGNADASGLVWLGIALLALGVVGALVAAVVPSLRARVARPVREAVGNARELAASPQRLTRLVLANVGSQLVYALVLGVSLRSLGAEASLAELLFVNTAVSLFSGLVPVPGGIGVAEAGLTAGLVAVGVPEQTALAAALIHRLLTFYLPPVWGYFALRWLGRHGFV